MIKVNVTTFRSTYADANPLWKVTEKRGRGTWIATVIDCPDYSGTKKAFTTSEIERSINMANFWEKSANDSYSFFNNLAVGSIVHYHSGFGEYVRCKVTDEHQLLPIALVGNWSPSNLPRRWPNGDIYNGYHTDCIKDGKTFLPHASCVYEYNRKINPLDPRELIPIILDVPPMTPEETVLANKLKTVELIQTITAKNIPPDKIFAEIKTVLGCNA